MTTRETEGRLERGIFHRLHRGVYAVGHRKLSRDGYLLAALFAAGPTAFLSHRTAAGLYGLRALNMRRIDLTVTARRIRPRAGLELHCACTAPEPGEVVLRYGLKVSSVPRMLLELSASETEAELERLITQAVRRRILNHERLERMLVGRPHHPGVRRLKCAYAAYRPRPERNSSLERDFDRLLEAHPEVPEPQRNVWLGEWELDYYWPEHRLVLELDGGPYHLAVRDIERDRLRDAQLLSAGIVTLRITDRRYNDDPEGAISDLLAALSSRTVNQQAA